MNLVQFAAYTCLCGASSFKHMLCMSFLCATLKTLKIILYFLLFFYGLECQPGSCDAHVKFLGFVSLYLPVMFVDHLHFIFINFARTVHIYYNVYNDSGNYTTSVLDKW